jgi:hypothetical protein
MVVVWYSCIVVYLPSLARVYVIILHTFNAISFVYVWLYKVLAMEYGASSEDIARTCHAHPTLSEA